MTLTVIGLEAIERAVPPAAILDTVRDALIAHAEGRTTVPPPIHLDFPASAADAHVKAGWIVGADDFAVKIASGSYRNHERGLPTNHGLVVVLSAETGAVRAVLDDGGRLTAWRTAAAGALTGHAMARPDAAVVGVFGTGEQARLQVAWLARLRPVEAVRVHGRDPSRVAEICAWFEAEGLTAGPASAREAAAADIVVTTTPATSPLFEADAVQPGAHVTGIGTDMPHKHELPDGLFARVDVVATDDHDQCLHHGDFGNAVRAGLISAQFDVSIGAILRAPMNRPLSAITVADLTGVGAIDAAVASLVVNHLLG
jgi:ornithine cyclodeaminase/alanine dehydrogenase-like protein (mu-crystallin family)